MVGREGSAWANITVIALRLPCIQMRLIYNKQPVSALYWMEGICCCFCLDFSANTWKWDIGNCCWKYQTSCWIHAAAAKVQSSKKEYKSSLIQEQKNHSNVVYCKEKIRQRLLLLFFLHLSDSRRIHLRKKEVQSSKLLLWLMPSISCPPASPLRQ